ncbi:MAG: peptidoglycan-associated lipoprotein Pal [Elusimicrobia bacterium]|nr:peptidoglycan-associated lipoprotein Pal [Elusimicrobiota bacterium]MBD3412068.1 peptidoglycan-associated lipoprotein Pal [Elusimicrobiota bacterium]
MKQRFVFWMAMIACCAFIASCAAPKKPAVEVEPEQLTTEEPDIRTGEWMEESNLATVYFDYDKAVLRSDAKTALKENAEYLKENADLEVLVEGHCDERGTIEYNMALGQRRAAAVRDYLSKLGISKGRISTISYGEEKPVDYGHTEAAWAKNRRAEFKVR